MFDFNSKKSLAPSEIRFMQDRINWKFRRGKSVNETIDDILAGKTSVDQIPRMDVAIRDGKYYSIDNRRLYMFRVLEKMGKVKNVEVDMVTYWPSRQFTTTNDGYSIKMRSRRGYTRPHAFESLLTANRSIISRPNNDSSNLSARSLGFTFGSFSNFSQAKRATSFGGNAPFSYGAPSMTSSSRLLFGGSSKTEADNADKKETLLSLEPKRNELVPKNTLDVGIGNKMCTDSENELKNSSNKIISGANIGIEPCTSAENKQVFLTDNKLDNADTDNKPGTNTENNSQDFLTENDPGTIDTGNEPDTIDTENESGTIDTENEPGTIDTGNEPGTIDTENEPGTIDTENELGTIDTWNEPGTNDTENEPGTIDTENEPGTIVTENEPGTIDTENEPDTIDTENEPGTNDTENEPGTSSENKQVLLLDNKPGTRTKQEPRTSEENIQVFTIDFLIDFLTKYEAGNNDPENKPGTSTESTPDFSRDFLTGNKPYISVENKKQEFLKDSEPVIHTCIEPIAATKQNKVTNLEFAVHTEYGTCVTVETESNTLKVHEPATTIEHNADSIENKETGSNLIENEADCSDGAAIDDLATLENVLRERERQLSCLWELYMQERQQGENIEIEDEPQLKKLKTMDSSGN